MRRNGGEKVAWSDVVRHVKEVFAIGTVREVGELYRVSESCRAFAQRHTGRWEAMYRGEPPWREQAGGWQLRAARLVCAYLAALNTAELRVQAGAEGSAANRLLQGVLESSAFAARLSAADELCEAVGGMVLKPYNRGRRIGIDLVPARCFVPLGWDGTGVREGVFVSESVRGESVYTRLEAHRFERVGGVPRLVIENRLFEKSSRFGPGLGAECALDKVPGLEELLPEAVFEREQPLFAYVRPGLANHLEPECPLGVSRFAGAVDTLEAIDKAFGEWQRDRVDCRKKILAPAEWFRRTLDERGRPVVEYDRECGVYQRLDYRPGEAQTPVVFAPDYQVERRIADLNALLEILCVQTGLSAGAIAFDEHSGALKTATEVRSDNARTFASVARSQLELRQGVRALAEAVLYLARHPDFGLLGAGETEVVVDFDDSVTPDRASHLAEGRELAQAGLISRYTFLTEYCSMSGARAEEELGRLQREGSAGCGALVE